MTRTGGRTPDDGAELGALAPRPAGMGAEVGYALAGAQVVCATIVVAIRVGGDVVDSRLPRSPPRATWSSRTRWSLAAVVIPMQGRGPGLDDQRPGGTRGGLPIDVPNWTSGRPRSTVGWEATGTVGWPMRRPAMKRMVLSKAAIVLYTRFSVARGLSGDARTARRCTPEGAGAAFSLFFWASPRDSPMTLHVSPRAKGDAPGQGWRPEGRGRTSTTRLYSGRTGRLSTGRKCESGGRPDEDLPLHSKPFATRGQLACRAHRCCLYDPARGGSA